MKKKLKPFDELMDKLLLLFMVCDKFPMMGHPQLNDHKDEIIRSLVEEYDNKIS